MAPSAVAQEGQESQGLLGHCPQVQSQVPEFKPVFFPLFLQCCLCPNLHPIQRLSGPPSGPRRSGRSCPKVPPLDVRPASLQDLPLSMTTSLASVSISALSWPTAPLGRALGTAPATQQQLCPQRSLEMQCWPPTQPVTSWKGPCLFPFGKISLGNLWSQGKPPLLPTTYGPLRSQPRETEHSKAKVSFHTSVWVIVNTHFPLAFLLTQLPIWNSLPLPLGLSRFSSILWELAQTHLSLESSLNTRRLLLLLKSFNAFAKWTLSGPVGLTCSDYGTALQG